MKQPLEFAYYQLINGKMYPAKIERKRLMPTAMPLTEGVTNANVQGRTEPQELGKIDTVTPKFSIQDDED